MAENGFIGLMIPKYDGDYNHWSLLMENMLRSKEWWDVVENGIGDSNVEATKKARKLIDLKAKNLLFQAIDRVTLESILCKDTSKDIWDSMKAKGVGSARMKKAQLQALRREFELLQMKEGEKAISYCSRIMEIRNKMRLYGESMKDTAIVEKILRSLSPRYDHIVVAIEESKDLDTLTLDELQSSLTVHEQKLNRNSTQEEQALKAVDYSQNRGGYRGRGQSRGRGRRGGHSKEEQQQQRRSDDEGSSSNFN